MEGSTRCRAIGEQNMNLGFEMSALRLAAAVLISRGKWLNTLFRILGASRSVTLYTSNLLRCNQCFVALSQEPEDPRQV